MIPQEKLLEIKKKIQMARKPLFFFDDDCDGICSFLLLKTLNDESTGVGVTGKPCVTRQHAHYVDLRNPDLVIVLDIGDIDQEFIDDVHVPILWIDHHALQQREGVSYYNPLLWNSLNDKPTSYLAYAVVQTKLWLAVTGIVADWCLPDNIPEIQKLFPGYLDHVANPAQALHETKFGQLSYIIDFNMKGLDKKPIQIANALEKIQHPDEIFTQSTPAGKFLWKRAQKKIEECQEQIAAARTCYNKKDPILLFVYSEQTDSFTREIANRMLYEFPDKLIIIVRRKGEELKMSLRCSEQIHLDLPMMITTILQDIHGYGGGHMYSSGAVIEERDFERFLEGVRAYIKKKKN